MPFIWLQHGIYKYSGLITQENFINKNGSNGLELNLIIITPQLKEKFKLMHM